MISDWYIQNNNIFKQIFLQIAVQIAKMWHNKNCISSQKNDIILSFENFTFILNQNFQN
jgi:hypothetical protein